jgi:hypothetical protein
MSGFWAGYFLGRGSGDDSIPPGIAIAFAVFLGFVVLLFVFQSIFEAIELVTHEYPIVSLFAVGVVTGVVGEVIGGIRDLDAGEKVLGPGALAIATFAVFWVVGELAGVSSFTETSLLLQFPMLVLSLVIVGGYIYMLVSLVRYHCVTRRGRYARTATLVFLAWWAWISVFNLSIPTVPVVEVDVFLVLGTITALAAGYVEEEAEDGRTRGLGETIA